MRDMDIMREEGALLVIDRLKETIKNKSTRIAPTKIGDTLITCSSSVDLAVIGIIRGKTLGAIVVL